MAGTKEPQYESCLELKRRKGLSQLGLMTNETWHRDPKRLTFVLARYKFVAKMLRGLDNAMEVGCADAFGTRIVQQEVPDITAVDFDEIFIEDCKTRMASEDWKFDCLVHDLLAGPVPIKKRFVAAYALDVIEHIPPDKDRLFVRNICASLSPEGVLILGAPSLHSQPYASEASKAGHVNCKDEAGMRELGREFFENVFIFSMNDEVVHTGFTPMAQYLFMLAVGKKGRQVP